MQRTPNQRDRIHSFLQNSTNRTYQTSPSPSNTTPKPKRQILCKIAFEIDEEQQELLIYDNVTLDMVTDQLIMKLNFANLLSNEPEIEISEDQRVVLEQQIKAKIEIIIESCIDNSPKAAKWKKKLRDFIDNKKPSPSITQKDLQVFKNLGSKKQNKGVKYFGYNTAKTDTDHSQSVSNSKTLEIIQRGKQVEHSLSRDTLKCQDTQASSHRLYYLGRRNDAIKEYLSKIREQYVQQQELNECTFHPNLGKLYLKTEHNQSQFSPNGQDQSVFNRLYKQALQKQEKMKIIQKELHEKQKQQFKHLNFIPSINSCSRQIVSAKKERTRNNTVSVYQHLYSQIFRKEKKNSQEKRMFQPIICPKSQQLAKKAKKNKAERQCFFNQHVRKEREKSPYQSQAQTKRSNQKAMLRKDKKSQSFLKQLQYFCNFQDQSPSNIPNNTLKERKNKKAANGLRDNQSQDASVRKRLQTSESDTIKPSKILQKSYKNVVDISAFGSEVQADGSYFKKTKENLFFLHENKSITQYKGNNHENVVNNILTQRINGCNEKQSTKSKKSDHHLKTKKGMLNPFEFFQEEQRKNNRTTNRIKTENTPTILKIHQDSNIENSINQQRIFQQIFEALNHKKTQQLDAQSIYQSNIIPANLTNVFLPMAEEMKQLNVGLDKQQFVWSLSRIYQTLTQQHRQNILNWSQTLALKNSHPTKISDIYN